MFFIGTLILEFKEGSLSKCANTAVGAVVLLVFFFSLRFGNVLRSGLRKNQLKAIEIH